MRGADLWRDLSVSKKGINHLNLNKKNGFDKSVSNVGKINEKNEYSEFYVKILKKKRLKNLHPDLFLYSK